MKSAVLIQTAPQQDTSLQNRLPPIPSTLPVTGDTLKLLRIYNNEGSILPFAATEICRTTSQRRELFSKLLDRAGLGTLPAPEIEALARISLDFASDRSLLGAHNIGPENAALVRTRRIEIIKKTTHRGVARYELDDQVLYDALKMQDKTISPRMLSDAVSRLPESKHVAGLAALSIATGFSSVHSLFQIANHPDLTHFKIFRFGSGSISESLKYLHKKSPSNFPLKFTNKLEHGSVVVLDAIAVQKIAESPRLQKELAAGYVRIVLPVGLENGISVYGKEDLTTDKISRKLDNMADKAQQLLTTEGITNPTNQQVIEAVTQVIAEPLLSKLPEEIRNKVELLTAQDNKTTQAIAANLAGPKHIISVEQVAGMMMNIPGGKESIDLFRDYLIRNITYFSDIKITETFQRLASNLESIRGNREVVFYLPKDPTAQETKSYHLMMNLFVKTMGLENVKIIEGTDALRDHHRLIEKGKCPESQLILIDDFAGTGTSLFHEYQEIRKTYKGQLAICSLASTDKAITLCEGEEVFTPGFHGFARLERQDPDFYYIPGEVVSKLGPKSLRHYTEDEQLIISGMCGTLGYGNIATCVMFPYMTPNNNFSGVEPFSICFTNGVGVKLTSRKGHA